MMRELQSEEIEQVSGGFEGMKIPFSNGFIPGESINGKPAGIVGAILGGWGIGFAIGDAINTFNKNQFNMSLGVAIYRTVNGGSNISSGGSKNLIPIVTIEEV
jgi:hypothetical protein